MTYDTLGFLIKHCSIYLYIPTTVPYSPPTKKGTFPAIFLKDVEQMPYDTLSFLIKNCNIYLYIPTTVPYSPPTEKGTFLAIFLKDVEQMPFPAIFSRNIHKFAQIVGEISTTTQRVLCNTCWDKLFSY